MGLETPISLPAASCGIISFAPGTNVVDIGIYSLLCMGDMPVTHACRHDDSVHAARAV